MNLLTIVRRSLRQHALSSAVTAASAALASGLVMAVFSVSAQSEDAFQGSDGGFDAVLGARGSQLQLVLNTVFHLETSPGNIPWSLYEQMRADRRVTLAVPYALGDNYRGFRIVGTTAELFTRPGGWELYPGHRLFDPELREAMLGSTVAMRSGLRQGSTFRPYHGLDFREGTQHGEEYLVTGVLRPTNSPADRVIWIPIEGVFRMGGHELWGSGERYLAEAGAAIPDEHKQISAVMLELGSPQAGFLLDKQINQQGSVATLAWPIATVMAQLFAKLGWMSRVLEMVAYLVVLVAAGSILASIYNTMNERRRELAILRALGARRSTVFGVILLEASVLAGLGALLGYAVYAAILGGAAWVIRRQTGVVLDVAAWHPVLVLTPPAMVLVGALAGLLPALKAYSTDVAGNLVRAA